MTTNLQAAARITVDGWTVEVEHAGQVGDLTHGIRNAWRWTITAPLLGDPMPDEITGEMPPIPARDTFTGRTYTGDDLRDPDPIGALCALAGVLDEYADTWTGLANVLPGPIARMIAARILAEFPEDPMLRTCDDCQAEPGEPCHPYCSSRNTDPEED